MCGIVGIVGRAEVASRLVDGLRRLEYRGYDSAGIATIAEGVETTTQLEVLRELGCSRAQGFLFSRPQLPQDLPALVGLAGVVAPMP